MYLLYLIIVGPFSTFNNVISFSANFFSAGFIKCIYIVLSANKIPSFDLLTSSTEPAAPLPNKDNFS